MPRFLLSIFLSALAFCGLAQSVSSSQIPSGKRDAGFVTVSGNYFLDASGQPLLLHGINVVNKSKEQGYTDNITSADFAQIRAWGMNAVRLCIFWDGLEPKPGHFDDAYLDRIAKLIGYAKQQRLYVLLDMHQDLYSVKFSDGAPLWATLDEGKTYTKTAEWSDAYYESEGVQTALDHFWANSPAQDGIGLQDHYAKAWQFVASRFKDEPTVIGYDLMNEPFPGRDAGRMEQAILTRLSELLAMRPQQPHPSPRQLFAMEGTPKGRKQITSWMGDMILFTGMLKAGTPIMQNFDRTRLMPMYARVRKAIRQVDSRHILFLEPAMSANLGIRTAIAPLVDDEGKRDPQQAYAPHVYDIVVDTAFLNLISNERIALIVRRHNQFSRRTRMPMLVGEWGAFYLNPAAAEVTSYIVRQFDKVGCGDMFWAYRRELTHWPGLEVLRKHAAAN
jgi:endoglycosylceramidase